MRAAGENTVCNMRRQLTLRSIPIAIDQALRRRARREGKSLNAVAVETLARGLGLEAQLIRHTDLDALIGSWHEDPAFERAMADFEYLDEGCAEVDVPNAVPGLRAPPTTPASRPGPP